MNLLFVFTLLLLLACAGFALTDVKRFAKIGDSVLFAVAVTMVLYALFAHNKAHAGGFYGIVGAGWDVGRYVSL